ncbi:MAG: leucine-rich repeat protein, partial [Candidatus Flemingiibacterium sp.]
MYIDTGSPVHLSEIRILPDVYESWNIIGIKIQASLDNSSWKTIYEFEDKDYNGVQIYCADLAESNLNKFQYYRIVTNGKNIAELELWYDDNGVDLPANSEDYFILADAESWYYNNVTTGDVWCDDTNYLASAENGLFITGVFNPGEEVVIPSYIGDRPVTGIAPYAFAGCDNIKSIKVEDSENSQLTYILRNAFSGCTNLESVSFAKALRCVDGAAFEGCESLLEFRGDWKPFTDEEIEARDNRYVVVHEGVLYTFGGTRLTKYPVARSDSYYSVLDGTTAIGGYAFSGAEALKKVDLPQSVAELNDSCFMESGLESITLPYSLRSIDCKAFKNCTNLTKVVSLNNNENLVLDKFANTEEDCIFYGTNPDLEVIAYAGGPEEEYCEEHGINFTASTSVVWFTGRDEINYYDYADNEVIITGVLAPYGETISSVPSVTQDGKTVVGIGDRAFTNSSVIGGDFKLPDTIRFIMGEAFAGTNIESLTIPKNLVNIWEGALANCQKLTRFTVDKANPYYHTDGYYSENSGIGLYRIGKPEDINDSTFVAYAMGCENESYTLPKEVFEIGIASFVGAE